MQPKNIDLNEVRIAYEAFPQQFDSLLMATVNAAGIPNASYATYVKDAGDYYVYVSELATHTQNLQQSGTASVLFIENEAEAQHLFARQRVTYQCESYEIVRDCERFGQIMGLFSEKFGGFMEMLKNLQDFHMICLHPIEGAYVQGFARAFIVDGENMMRIRHMNDTGHKSSRSESQHPTAA